ncbi:MAG TPA: ribosome-associated translation inhibitor RaiA [Trueperaceae bacterium]|nr:ribosome-associated translation inhibitor RaiA [Trueperaceae bacterium]
MNIYQLIGRNLEITDAMRQYTEDKLSKLDRFSDQIVDARVTMSHDNNQDSANPNKVEVQVNVPNGIIRAEERSADMYAAIDLVVDKLERQLKRFKGRLIAKRSEAAPQVVEPEPEQEAPSIVRVKRHVMRPMAPEDAAVQMEALGHEFYVFRNIETDLVTVIYLRTDGDYGLIEPAN